MESKKSFLNLSSVEILPNLSVRIPTVGEILKDEDTYFNLVYSLTATPFQYMVQLDDMGIDYTTITDYGLFKILFPIYAKSDLSILFGSLKTSDFDIYMDPKNNSEVVYSPQNKIEIDEFVYHDLSDVIRKINLLKKEKSKPGNESAKKYLLERERKKQKRNTKKPQEAYLEKMVIALTNNSEFPYNYDNCMDLSIYRFHQSFKQIQHKIAFDNTMFGIYSGAVDMSKLGDRDCLSWIPIK